MLTIVHISNCSLVGNTISINKAKQRNVTFLTFAVKREEEIYLHHKLDMQTKGIQIFKKSNKNIHDIQVET